MFIRFAWTAAALALKGHRDIFAGILRYARANGPWRLYRMEGRPGEQRLLDLQRWGCTGMITAPCTLREARTIAGTRVPVVVVEPDPGMLEPGHPLAECSCLRVDSQATGELAARFFLERHYRHFAFVGEVHDLYWSRARGEGFKAADFLGFLQDCHDLLLFAQGRERDFNGVERLCVNSRKIRALDQ